MTTNGQSWYSQAQAVEWLWECLSRDDTENLSKLKQLFHLQVFIYKLLLSADFLLMISFMNIMYAY